MPNTKFVKYLLVGLLNTVFGYSAFALLIFLNIHYVLASFLATIAGILFNFKTIGRIVFKNNDNSIILKFFAVYGFNFLLGLVGLKIFNNYNFNMYLAGFILLIATTPVSFYFNNRFVFNNNIYK